MRATVWGNVDEVSLRKALASPPSATQSGRAETSEMTHVTRIKWRDMVREVQAQIGSETLKKAVIARSMTLTAQEPFDPADIIEALSMDAENCILFAYHQPDRGTFLGATPERLFHLQHNQLTVDSLAGTRPRGKNAEEDVNFSRELSESSKDKVEQEFVTRHILECLPSFAETVQASVEPRVRKLSSVQHLQTTGLAELKPRASLDGLVNALHPTPATCGVPADRARQMISELEPLPRGLYAGLIGWITADEAEFAVMIRSGLIQENTAHLFAGAGIVADSDPDAEYDECEWKMEPMRRAVSPRFSEGIKGG
jgi:menaquinone-specific isochorismate synthase